jgi:hypothetical protein
LDISTVYPLNIVKKTDRNQWFPTSWFDNNYEQFGYNFPREGIEGLLYWEKNDGSDIFNFDQAQDMAYETTNELKDYQRQRRGDFYASSFNHPLLCDREKTLDLTQEQYCNLINSIDFDNLFYEHTNRDYFIPLLKKLRGKDV